MGGIFHGKLFGNKTSSHLNPFVGPSCSLEISKLVTRVKNLQNMSESHRPKKSVMTLPIAI